MLKIAQSEKAIAASTLARGFCDDPLFSFVFPQAENRIAALEEMFQVFVADAIARGEVLLAPEKQGAIAWYPAGIQVFDDTFEAVLAEAFAIVAQFGGEDAMERFEQIGKIVQQHEPKDAHHEVFWLAIAQEARGKGLGGDLLRPVLDDADAKNVPCYLVSSNPRNISFYERHGFRQAIPMAINSAVLLTGMWRDPQK
jgi:ribosomal protein S18 acetylase RimI-like enzyme